MTHAAVAKPSLAFHIIKGPEVDTLDSIWSSECGVAVYQREPMPNIANWLDTLPAHRLPKARLSLKTDQVQQAMVDLFAEYGVTEKPVSDLFANDISKLAKQFSKIMNVKDINLRLDVVNNNACRKYHQDNVAARLLCAYRGRGTEFGPCFSSPEPEEVQELSLHSVGIFKGRLWPDKAPSAIYHRSPQIEGSGETRLLLVIDTPTCDDDNCTVC